VTFFSFTFHLLSLRLSRAVEGRYPRKQHQGGGASDILPHLAFMLSFSHSYPLSLPLSWGDIASPLPRQHPFCTQRPWHAVSRVQRTPRFALRLWRVFPSTDRRQFLCDFSIIVSFTFAIIRGTFLGEYNLLRRRNDQCIVESINFKL